MHGVRPWTWAPVARREPGNGEGKGTERSRKYRVEIDSNLELVVELAERAHLPTITSGSHFVKAGSLMS